MSKQSETIRIGLLTALVVLALIGAFAIVAAPGDRISIPAHALMKSSPGRGGNGDNNYPPRDAG
jgi:hypothetical protein